MWMGAHPNKILEKQYEDKRLVVLISKSEYNNLWKKNYKKICSHKIKIETYKDWIVLCK